MTDKMLRVIVEQRLQLDALDMVLEESRSSVCPFCDGGDTHEKSFSCTRKQEGIYYHCFRVKCKESGFISLLTGAAEPAKRKPARHFTRPLENVPQDIKNYLEEMYDLKEEDIHRSRWKWDYIGKRLYMPIITEEGWEAGATSKLVRMGGLEVSAVPKTLTYFWSPLYRLHVAPSEVDGGPLVVVEDQISAAKVARQARCVALLGTHMSPEVANRIRLLSTKVIIALDADTWSHSRSIGYNMKQKYGLLFENFSVIRLSKDPKSMTDNEIRRIILGNGEEDPRGSSS